MAIIVGAAIGIILLVLLCGIGIYQVISKKPAIFFAGERRYREDELKSVRLWNVEHGLMWIVYGMVVSGGIFLSIVYENSNMADYIIPATTVVPIPVMVLNHYRLIKKYVK